MGTDRHIEAICKRYVLPSNYDGSHAQMRLGWIYAEARWYFSTAVSDWKRQHIAFLAYWQRHMGILVGASPRRAGDHRNTANRHTRCDARRHCSATVVKAAILSALRLVDESNQ